MSRSWRRTLATCVLLLLGARCGAAGMPSICMSPASSTASMRPTAGNALIVFVRPEPGDRGFAFTLTDDRYQWIGDLDFGLVSYFGFGSTFIVEFGPIVRYQLGSMKTRHRGYVTFGLPLRMVMIAGGYVGEEYVGSQSSLGIGIHVGGGYYYLFTDPRRPGFDAGFGFDLAVVPTPFFSGDRAFLLGINVIFGVRMFFPL